MVIPSEILNSLIVKMKNNHWKPTFKKHMHLQNITIKTIDRRVSTKGDECNLVGQKMTLLEVHSNYLNS